MRNRARPAWPFSSAALLAAAFSSPAFGQATPPVSVSLDLHFGSMSYSGCSGGTLPSTFTCQSIETANHAPAPPIFVSILVGGIVPFEVPGSFGGIGAVQFGLRYPPSVALGEWVLCTGGAEAPGPDWPSSGSGNAATWPLGCRAGAGNPAGLARVGYFALDAASAGIVQLTGDPRMDDEAWFYDCNAEGYFICPPLLGSGDATLDGRERATACGTDCSIVDVHDDDPVSASWGRIKSLYE